MAACTSIDCPLSNTVSAVYQLQTPSGAPDTLKIDTMWVWAERANGTDTLLVNRLCGTNATKVSIPMSYMQEFDNIHTLIINKTEVTNDASTAHFLLRLKARR